HAGAVDVVPESFPERPMGKEVPSLPASYFCSLCYRHHCFKHNTVQACDKRDILLPWRGCADEHLAESAINDLVPNTHHPLAALNFMVCDFGDAFKKPLR